jgi:hypothetical protein
MSTGARSGQHALGADVEDADTEDAEAADVLPEISDLSLESKPVQGVRH